MVQQQTIIVMHNSVLRAYAALPKNVRKQFENFLEKFQENPKAPGIHLEKINNTADDKLYSVRIDQKYRGVIGYQKESGVYVVLYIGNHDDAYAWAVKKRLEVNTLTNTIQLYDVVTAEEQDAALSHQHNGATENAFVPPVPKVPSPADSVDGVPTTSENNESRSAFSKTSSNTARTSVTAPMHVGPLPDSYRQLTIQEMRELGVPDPYVNIMSSRTSWEQFEEWGRRLPDDARAYLELIAEGCAKTDVLAMARTANEASSSIAAASHPVSVPDTGVEGDFRKALTSYSTQQSFVVIKGQEDLRRVLDAPLEQWRIFLHPYQRYFVDHDYHGPFRLLGGAGTGKTVVAMHRARRLAASLLKQGSRQKVLFTTYSRNLATDISSNLKQLCSVEEFNKIDVINLDRFVSAQLKEHGYSGNIWFDGSADHGDDLNNAWSRAIRISGIHDAKLTVPFLKSEWRQVIVPAHVQSVPEYLRVLRKGRGTKLSRAQKLEVWRVVETYQRVMQSQQAYDVDMAMSYAETLLREQNGPKKYAHVIVDEGQDFSAPAYRVIRALVDEGDNDIFIVGDAQQRIYGRKAVLSKCGIRIQGRARKLRVNYRTTEQIRGAADRIFLTSGPDVADSVFEAVDDTVSPNSQVTEFDDLNGEEAPVGDSRSLMMGPVPEARLYVSQAEEVEAVKRWIVDRCGLESDHLDDDAWESASNDGAHQIDPRNVCVVARNHFLVSQWRDIIDDQLPYGAYQLGPDEDNRQMRGIRLATMHRVKGLEFDCVVIVDVNDNVLPTNSLCAEVGNDEVALQELYKQERSLLYVAMTRARKEVLIVGVGKPKQH